MFVSDLKIFYKKFFKKFSICNGLIRQENIKNDPPYPLPRHLEYFQFVATNCDQKLQQICHVTPQFREFRYRSYHA